MRTKTRLTCPSCSATFNKEDAGAGWLECTVNNRTSQRWCCPDCRFAEMQNDMGLDNLTVVWAGQNVLLMDGNQLMAQITADVRAVAKIKAWCLKNSYRCSAIKGDKIYL